MKILVVGATGLVGPPLVRQLHAAGHDVIIFHRGVSAADLPPVRRIIGDRHQLAASANELRRLAPEIVIDVILSSGRHAEELMRIFGGVARRVVVASSMDVYRAAGVLHGSEPGPLEPVPLTEESSLRSNRQTYPPEQVKALQSLMTWVDDEYVKIAVERAVSKNAELPATVLRLPMIYGPGDRLHRLYPLVKRMDDGRARILFADDVAAWRGPRGYSENVAAALALAAVDDRAAGRVYNVCEEEAFTELEWARLVAAQTGWRGEFVVVPAERAPQHLRIRGNLAQHWAAGSGRIRRELAYREIIPRDEALHRTIAWERAHPPQVIPALFDYEAEDRAA